MDVEIVEPHRRARSRQRRGAARARAARRADRARTSRTRRSTYLDAREAHGRRACRACSSASASSASSATSCTSRARTASTSGTRSSSAAPTSARGRSGSRRSAILRLEKQHVHRRPGHRLRVERRSTRTCPGSSRSTRTTSSASGRSSTCAERGARELLVGFEMAGRRACPPEGGQVVRRRPAGRPGHERALERAARQDDRPRVGAARARRGGRALRDPRQGRAGSSRAQRPAAAVLRPRRGAAAVVTALEFLSARPAPAAAVSSRAAARRSTRALVAVPSGIAGDLSLALGKLEVRGGGRRPRARRRDPDHADARRSCVAPTPEARRRGAAASSRGFRRRPHRRARRVCASRAEAATLMRRLTDLDLGALPAAGKVAGVQAIVPRRRRVVRALLAAGVRPLRRRGRARRRRRASREGHLPRAPHVAPARRAEAALRRRHRSAAARTASRRRTTSRRTTASRDVAVLEQSYIGSGAAGRNTTIIRANYRTPEGVGVLRGERQALRAASSPSSTSTCSSRSRATSRSPTPTGRSSTMTERAEVNQLLGRRQPPDRPRRDRASSARSSTSRDDVDVADHGRALPPARRDHPPRRGRLGLRARRRPRAASSSTRTRRSPGSRGERPRHRRADDPRRHRLRHGHQRDGRLVDARRRPGRRAACRSRRTSCRRS